MTVLKTIFVGWVDISLEDWVLLGYENQQEWSTVIVRNNLKFQQRLLARLPGRQIVGARDNKKDEDSFDQDLLIRFSDVRFDVNSYRLFASIHFVDPQSGKELASVPLQSYRGGNFSVDNCLSGALDKVAQKIGERVPLSWKR